VERKIIFYSKLPTTIKEGFDIALERDELESTTVSIKEESKLGLLFTQGDCNYLIIMDTPAVQDLNEEDEMDINLQDGLE